MAKIFIQAAAIAAVVFFLAFVSLSVWRPLQPAVPQNESQRTEHSEGKNTEAQPHKGFLDRTVEDPVAFFTLWLTLFTGILATVTIWLALSTSELRDFAEEQARDMKGAIAAAQKSADAAEIQANVASAAFTKLERPYLIPSAISEIGQSTTPSGEGYATVTPTISNPGRSPAFHRSTSVKFLLLNGPLEVEPDYSTREPHSSWGEGFTVSPGSNLPGIAFRIPREIGPVNAPGMTLYMFMAIQYEDIFGVSRTYYSCWRYTGSRPPSAAFYRHGGKKYNYETEISE